MKIENSNQKTVETKKQWYPNMRNTPNIVQKLWWFKITKKKRNQNSHRKYFGNIMHLLCNIWDIYRTTPHRSTIESTADTFGKLKTRSTINRRSKKSDRRPIVDRQNPIDNQSLIDEIRSTTNLWSTRSNRQPIVDQQNPIDDQGESKRFKFLRFKLF